jgi:hypothetical protein
VDDENTERFAQAISHYFHTKEGRGRNCKEVPQLQQFFAQTILGMDALNEFGGDRRVYMLDVLADRDFVFQYPMDCGVEDVSVKRLRLSLKTGGKRRVTVEADPNPDPKTIYDLIEELKLPPFFVSQAVIKVTFAPTPDTRSRTRSFTISFPNCCALRHDGRDLVIRQMLADSGLEPMVPETTECLTSAKSVTFEVKS